jgi:alkaline phosphatase D
MFNRRLFIAGAAASGIAAPAIVRAQNRWRSYPFSLGVAAGDPAPDGFVIWTRLAPEPLASDGGMAMFPMPVQWEVASDSRFETIVQSGEVIARPELAHAVHVEVMGLQPDRPYFYRFTAGGERSFRGVARTLPLASADVARLKFGVAGCQRYDEGYYGAFRHLSAEQDLAFVYHYGDYIYEYQVSPVTPSFWSGGIVEPVRPSLGQSTYSIDDYRRRYAEAKSDGDLIRAHAAHAFVCSYDDHEVDNNWVSDQDADGVDAEIFALRRAAAFQAWYEHMPVRKAQLPRGGAPKMYRDLKFGRLAHLDICDTRLYRTNQPCGDGFKPHCAEVDDRNAQVLGAEQEAWVARNLSNSDHVWNALAQQITMMSLDRRRRPEEPARVLNMDSWAGYEVPRQRLLARMAGRQNVVVLTGDEHQNFCGNLVHRDKIVGGEFVATSISSGGSGQDKRPGTDEWLKANPELKFANDQRGYLVCEVTPEAWQSHFMVVDQVRTRENSLSRRMTALVARDEAGVKLSA